MKITKIEVQAKQKGRYSVFVDDEFAFGISESGLLISGLRTGQELSQEELAALKEGAKTDKLYNQVLGLIARRPRSKWELENYLKRKAVEPARAEEVMGRLSESGFVDDYGFARRWVENRRLLKPISRRKLMLELKAKRIADSVIQEVLSEDDTNEFGVLLSEIEKKRRQPRYQDDTRLMQYLARQGYSYDDIKRALSGSTW